MPEQADCAGYETLLQSVAIFISSQRRHPRQSAKLELDMPCQAGRASANHLSYSSLGNTDS